MHISASAGGDQAAASLEITSDDADFTGYFTAGASATETQQLMFQLTASSIPEYIGIDIDLSLFASLGGDLSGLPGEATATAQSSVQVVDLDSFELTGASPISGAADMPFSATAFVDGAAGSDVVDGIYTVLLRPNRRYEVILSAFAAFDSSSMNSLLHDFDFSDLDLTFTAFADPVFSLNQNWLDDWLDAGNPAFDLVISRTINAADPVNVAAPAPLALLAGGIGMLVLLRRPGAGLLCRSPGRIDRMS